MAIPIRDNHWRQIPHPLRQYYIINWAHNIKLSLSFPMDAMHFLQSKKTWANRSNEAINIRICKKQVPRGRIIKAESIQRLDWLRLVDTLGL